jgi:hypothetical protein
MSSRELAYIPGIPGTARSRRYGLRRKHPIGDFGAGMPFDISGGAPYHVPEDTNKREGQ